MKLIITFTPTKLKCTAFCLPFYSFIISFLYQSKLHDDRQQPQHFRLRFLHSRPVASTCLTTSRQRNISLSGGRCLNLMPPQYPVAEAASEGQLTPANHTLSPGMKSRGHYFSIIGCFQGSVTITTTHKIRCNTNKVSTTACVTLT